jgi:6-phosphogluconolactonase
VQRQLTPFRAALFFLPFLAFGACGDDGQATGGSGGSTTTQTGGPGATGSTSTKSTTTGADGGGGEGSGGSPGQTVPYVYVGTSDDKIFVMLLDRDTGALSPVGEIDAGANPSFLAPDPQHRFLFAVNEGSSEVAAFSIAQSSGELTFINRVGSEGNGPAHVSVATNGEYALVANYGSGHIASIAIADDGSLDDTLVSVHQAGQNAHLIKQDPATGFVHVPCLGSNYVRSYDLDSATGTLTPLPDGTELDMAPGSGPRHLDYHPTLDVAYVVNEQGDTVVVAERAPTGELTELQVVPTLPNGVDGDDNACADIHVSPDGRFVYASNRGHNSLAIYSVDQASGELTPIGHQGTGGDWPRNFTIDPAGEIILVANQQSDNIVAFRVDSATGLLTELVTTPTQGGPAFVGVITQGLTP